MRLRAILSDAGSVLNNALSYSQRRRKGKLYQEWVERAGLPPEAIPHEEVAEDIMPKIDTERLRQPLLYMLLGAALLILCFGVILLIVHAC